jgi:DHA2 family lincomycin resistance protein-like MFS transporter
VIDTHPSERAADLPAAARPAGLPPHARTVITVLLVAAFVAILNETIISVAIPVLMRELGIDASTGQWLSTAFMLTLAVVIPVTGFLIQRVPTRSLFLLAVSLFSAGTLLAAVAPGFVVLLLARIVQGTGTALMFPLLMTTVMALVPEAGRGRMMGNISLVIAVAPALGPVVGGVVLNFLSWRWMFLVVLPIAIVSLLIGVKYMTNVGETKRVRVDVISVPLAALGFGGLVYALNAVGSGGGPAEIAVPATLGGVALTTFLVRQFVLQRTDRALLDLRPFTSRVFSASVVAASVAMVALLGAAILLPIYLQNVLGTSPLVSGLLVLPGGVVMGILGPVVGGLYDRVGPRALLLPGAAVVTVALGLLAMAGTDTPVWFVLVAHVVLSIGLAFVLTPLFTAGLGAVPPRFAAHGSAIFGTVQQVGGAAGTALVVTLLAVGAAGRRAEGAGVVEAQASGLHLAFLVAAAVSVTAIVAAAFVTRPTSFAPTQVDGAAAAA